jgi:hypothetical protein
MTTQQEQELVRELKQLGFVEDAATSELNDFSFKLDVPGFPPIHSDAKGIMSIVVFGRRGEYNVYLNWDDDYEACVTVKTTTSVVATLKAAKISMKYLAEVALA